jgi:hypothetical protein
MLAFKEKITKIPVSRCWHSRVQCSFLSYAVDYAMDLNTSYGRVQEEPMNWTFGSLQSLESLVVVRLMLGSKAFTHTGGGAP